MYRWAGIGSLQLLPDLTNTGSFFTFSGPPYSATLPIAPLCYEFPLDGPGE